MIFHKPKPEYISWYDTIIKIDSIVYIVIPSPKEGKYTLAIQLTNNHNIYRDYPSQEAVSEDYWKLFRQLDAVRL